MTIDLTPLEGASEESPSIFVSESEMSSEYKLSYPLCKISEDAEVTVMKLKLLKKLLTSWDKSGDSVQIWFGTKMLGYCSPQCWKGFLTIFDPIYLSVELEENMPISSDYLLALC